MNEFRLEGTMTQKCKCSIPHPPHCVGDGYDTPRRGKMGWLCRGRGGITPYGYLKITITKESGGLYGSWRFEQRRDFLPICSVRENGFTLAYKASTHQFAFAGIPAYKQGYTCDAATALEHLHRLGDEGYAVSPGAIWLAEQVAGR